MNQRFKFNLSIVFACLVSLSLFVRPALAKDELNFAWPVPSRVTVTETVLKKGQTAKMRYDMVLTAQSKGENRELKFDKFKFIELDGTDLSVPENQEKLAPVLKHLTAMGSMLPTLVITPDGDVDDVVGMDECAENALKLLPSPDPKIAAMLRSPEMIAQMKAKSQDFWRVWVQTWLMSQPTVGKDKTLEIEIPLLGGLKMNAPLTVRNEGPVRENASEVKLTAQTVLEGEPARKALQDMMMTLVAKVPPKEGVKPFSPDMIKSLKRSTKFVVVTNPQTMQPQSAESESIIDLAIEDQQKTETEKHEYVFDWSANASAKP
jgi:hypothetical protein